MKILESHLGIQDTFRMKGFADTVSRFICTGWNLIQVVGSFSFLIKWLQDEHDDSIWVRR